MSKISVVVVSLLCVSVLLCCKQKQKVETVKDTRTSGTTTILVDESYTSLIEDQIEVFVNDYPNTKVNILSGNENEILPKFISGEVKMLVLSRLLKPEEERFYKQRKSPIYVDRFAIDGIALIVSKNNPDSTITVQDAFDIMRGKSNSNKQLVFDNAYSSTIRYFIDSAGIKELPKKGVYTLKTPNDVIKFVSENNNYVGVISVNWLLQKNKNSSLYLPSVKTLGVKNQQDKNRDSVYYQPTQKNLINGKYPLLRNVFTFNGEGTNGLGTGFATWLASPRGQLIVLKSGLGPHTIAEREFNLKTDNKK